MSSLLTWHRDHGMKEVPQSMASILPRGTYVRFGDSTSSPWKLRTKRRTAGHKWTHIPKKNLPKQVHVDALLLEIRV